MTSKFYSRAHQILFSRSKITDLGANFGANCSYRCKNRFCTENRCDRLKPKYSVPDYIEKNDLVEIMAAVYHMTQREINDLVT